MSTHLLRPPRARLIGLTAAAALGLGGLSALTPAQADTQTSGTATATVADTVVGTAIHVTGTGWTTTAGDNGSTIGVKIDDSATIPASGTVANPTDNPPETPFTKPIWAAISAGPSGSFSADIAFPTPSNTSPAIAAGAWAAGTTHTLRLLTGSMEKDDVARSMQLTFTVTAAPADPGTVPGAGGGTSSTPPTTTGSHAAAVAAVTKDKAVIKKLKKRLKTARGAQRAKLKKKLAQAKKQLKRDQRAAR